MSLRLSYILAGLGIADLLAAIDGTAITIALPKLAENFGISPALSSLVLVVYTSALVAFLIPLGRFGDRYGHKRSFLIGCLLLGITSLGIIVSPSFYPILAFRLVQGIAAAMLYTASGALIAYGWKRTEVAFGITAACFSIGLLVGPVLGGLLTDRTLLGISGWHWIFAINIPFAVVAYYLLSKFAPETELQTTAARTRVTGIVLLVSTLALAVTAMITPYNRIFVLAAAAVFLILFLWQDRQSPDPLLSSGLFKNSVFRATAVFTMLCMFSLIGMSFLNSFFLQDLQGHDATTSGILMLPIPLGMAAFSALAGLVRRWKTGLLIGGAGIIFGLTILSTVTVSTPYFHGLFWGYLLVSAGGGFMMTHTFAAALGSVPTSLAGIAAGYINTAQQLGSLGGTAFVAGNALTRYSTTYLILAVVVVCGTAYLAYLNTNHNELPHGRGN